MIFYETYHFFLILAAFRMHFFKFLENQLNFFMTYVNSQALNIIYVLILIFHVVISITSL